MLLKISRSEILLLIVAIIWGFAFVAQRSGMDHIGPFTFNGIRFLLGACCLLVLLPLINAYNQNNKSSVIQSSKQNFIPIKAGMIIGVILFFAANLQQAGLIYTIAANAGFITSLYIILVPIIGLLLKQKTTSATWIGATCALIGLALLSIKNDLSVSFGDILQFIGAMFWALHILAISRYAPKSDPFKLSIIQFLICGSLSLFIGLLTEVFSIHSLTNVLPAILYTGVLSTAIAYTLQVVAQQKVPAAHATIIFSLEAVFALIGGWLFLNESLSLRGLLGCSLMFIGVIISQRHMNN